MRTCLPPLGLPLYWRNEASGVLPRAIWKFINHMADHTQPEPTADELALIITYLDYHIHASCWDTVESFEVELAELRRKVKELKTAGDITGWINEAMEIAIDPL